MNLELLSIGAIARDCGVSADTIRHYERKGVLTDISRDPNGYRRYPAATIERVRLIRRALEIGFTLNELARIFRQRASGRPPCRQVHELATSKLTEIDQRIAALMLVRTTLTQILASWGAKLQSVSDGEPAHLLESLIDTKEDSTCSRS